METIKLPGLSCPVPVNFAEVALETAIRNLTERARDQKQLLTRLEWSGVSRGPGNEFCPACPYCSGVKTGLDGWLETGHKPGCELKRLIQ